MGITSFYKFFSESFKNKYISDLEGSVILIDAPFILNKYGIGIRNKGSDKKNNNNEIINHLYAIEKYTLKILKKGILPIYIFDGKSTDIKKYTLIERRKRKLDSEQKCCVIDDKNSDEYIKHFKRSYAINPKNILECQNFLTFMGIPWIQALEEADAQCTILANKFYKEISGVVSNDSDMLVLGSPKIFRDFNPKNIMTCEISLNSVIQFFFEKINECRIKNKMNKIKFDSEFIKDKFIEFCILLGSDYGKLIIIKHNSSDNELFELFVLNDLDISKLLNNMRYENTKKMRYYINDNFMENFLKIKYEYTDAYGYCPESIDFIKIKKPEINNLKKFLIEKMSYDDKYVKIIIDFMIDNYNIFTKTRNIFDSFISCNKKNSRSKLRFDAKINKLCN